MTLRKLAVLYALMLILSMAGVLIGYRYFVSIPNITQTIDNFHQRELITLNRALDKEIGFLQTINYDYAVWDDSYNFIKDTNESFIETNLINDTFASLKIDGIYFYDLNHNMIWGKGFDHVNQESIGFSELNLHKNPQLRTIYPDEKNDLGVKQNGGFMSTRQGPVMFSSTEIKHSDRSGVTLGALVFIRRVRPGLIKSLEALSGLNLSSINVSEHTKVGDIARLNNSLNGESFVFKRQRVITDPAGSPVVLLNIQHQHTDRPELFDKSVLFTLLLLSLIPLSLLLFVNHYFIHPVINGTKRIRQMVRTQRFEHIKEKINIAELNNLTEDFNQLITTVNNHEAELEKLVLTDDLSKIPNRRAFEQFIASSWARMQRNQQPIALLMCDIDYFKAYNDNYGHQAGDKAIIQVAQALHQKINRASDIVARYGGEEFVVVLADSSKKNCNAVIAIILDTVRQLCIAHGHSTVTDHLTISVGAALSTEIAEVPLNCHYEQLIGAADHALYQAKNAGRNRAVKVQFNAVTKETEFTREVI